jgi:hypothetical protein
VLTVPGRFSKPSDTHRDPRDAEAGAVVRPLEVALRLTAIALLLRPMGGWFVRPVIMAAAVLVLVSPRALRMPALWLGVSIAIAFRIAADWPLADNHIYLLAYWCVAIALSLHSKEAHGTLAFNSRALIGLAFAFAVLWKAVLSPDFLDGRFFRVTLQTDPRFGEPAMLIGGLSSEQLDANRNALMPLPQGAELLNPPRVFEPQRLRILASVATWGILILEASVAALMLVPSARISARWRHAALLTFCLVTYPFAPVAGFGWLLLLMGVGQTDQDQVWLRRIYVGAFVAVLFYTEVPWAGLLLDLGR